jgi:hypothetical protein
LVIIDSENLKENKMPRFNDSKRWWEIQSNKTDEYRKQKIEQRKKLSEIYRKKMAKLELQAKTIQD